MKTYDLAVFTATTHWNRIWYYFILGPHSLWVAADVALGPPAKLRQHLANRGLVLTERDAVRQLQMKVADAEPYEGEPPIDQPGWNDKVFAWPDDTVSVPTGSRAPVTTYRIQGTFFARRGTRTGWRRYANPLGQQPLPAFLLALPLAAVIRSLLRPSDDLIFELVMPSRAEIDLPGLIIGSVTGGVTGDQYHHAQFHSALWTPSPQDPYNDQLLVLREPEVIMAGATAASRTNDVRARISHGVRSVGHPWLRPCTTLILGRERFSDLAGEGTDISRLAEQRIVTMNVAPERTLGVLDQLPSPFTSWPEYAAHLRAEVACHHGVVLRRFVGRVVRLLDLDEAALKGRVQRFIARFRHYSQCDINDAEAVRIADAFGLLYAAGRLAQSWDLFPKEWRVKSQLLTCYRTFYKRPVASISFDQELLALLHASDTLHVGRNQPEPSEIVLAEADVIVIHRATHLEMVIRPTAIGRLIRNWEQRTNDPQVVARAHREKGKNGKPGQHKQRRTTIDKNARVYCFILPLEWITGAE